MSDRPEFDELFPASDGAPLGIVVEGSLSAGLTVKLNPQFSMEKLAVGRYVVIRGRETGRQFFGLLTDLALGTTNPDLARRPPSHEDDFTADVLRGGLAYGTAHISPMLMLDEETNEPKPIKTIPAHFSSAFEASAEDVARVFGEEDESHFFVGTPLVME